MSIVARVATAAIAGLAGILLIAGSVGVWRTTDEMGLSRLRIAGTGSYGFDGTLATHPIGWVLIGVGVTLLLAAGAGWVRPAWSGVATTTLGGVVSVAVIEPHRRSRMVVIAIVGGIVLGVVAVIIGAWAPEGTEIHVDG